MLNLKISKKQFISLSINEISNLFPEFESDKSRIDVEKLEKITGINFEWSERFDKIEENKSRLYDILIEYEKNKISESTNMNSTKAYHENLVENKRTLELEKIIITKNNVSINSNQTQEVLSEKNNLISNQNQKEKENNEMNINNDIVTNNVQAPINNFIDSNVDLSKIKLTMNGLGIQGKDGTIKTYKNGKIIDVTQFSFQGDSTSSFVFLLPAKKVKTGDLIVNNGSFVFVVNDDGNMITAVDFDNNSQRTIIRQQHALIPFSFVTKVYSPLNGGNMSNMLPFMMMNNSNGGGMNNMMQMMMMSKMFKNMNEDKTDDTNVDDDDIFGDMNKMFNI